MLSKINLNLGYILCKANYEVWLIPAKTPNVFEYHEYVLIFLGDSINIYHDSGTSIKTFGNIDELKPNIIVKPDNYLGELFCTHQTEDGRL